LQSGLRPAFYIVSAVVLAAIGAGAWFSLYALYALIVVGPLVAVGVKDCFSRYNVLNNYPVIGHARYMLEFVRPELRQYFFEGEHDGRPFNRAQRSIIHTRADGGGSTSPFGTTRDMEDAGFDFAEHSIAPKNVDKECARITIGGPQCERPYNSSRLNISAMSFGALSANAVMAMNKGAMLGGFAQDTGEGGLSPYHLKYGADIVWELGSAYFGCRHTDGSFDADEFKKKSRYDCIKMIEIKISQGAKPGHGGLLPAAKITKEIAETREVEMGKDCLSPAAHPEFGTPGELLEFVVKLRELCGGKPVGFKLCLGRRSEFLGICKAMVETGILPDFITVDGAEGGTGAAPLEHQDFVGTYINEAIPFVHNCLLGVGVRDKIRVIASGKVAMGFDMVVKCALGADLCNAARPFMFSVGCIQARRCHTDSCPTGVTTQNPSRMRSLHVDGKALRVRNFHDATIGAYLDMVGTLGAGRPEDLKPDYIYHRPEYGPAITYADMHPTVAPGDFLEDKIPPAYAEEWHHADAERF
jgi:glutamate synthase domain-containing protein 2